MVKLNWNQYITMWNTILAWKKANGKLPNYIEIFGYRFMKVAFQDAANRVTNWRNTHNNQNPLTVEVQGTAIAPTPTPSKNKGKWTTLFEQKMGVTINSGDDAYNHLKDKGAGYSYYYDDIKSNTTIINNLANPNDGNKDSNCTDITQLLKKIYDEFNEKVEFIRAEVKCSNGVWYGHVFLRKVATGKYVDGAAKLAHNYSIGTLICVNGVRNITVNPSWLVNAADNQ